MKIKRIPVGPLQANCYVIIDKDNYALIIDPGDEPQKIIEVVSSYNVEDILITHSHADHIGALKELKEYFKIDIMNREKHISYETIPTPGHTKDSVSYYFKKENIVFTGDFIFEGTIGRTDLGGNSKEMKESIQYFLKRFSDTTIIYPGHGPSTTLEKERKNLENILEYL